MVGKIKKDEGDTFSLESGRTSPGRWISSTIQKMKGATAAKLEDMVERFNRVLPIIEEAGFRVSEIEAVMTVPPSVIAHVRIRELLEGDEREALLAGIAHRKMASHFLRSLYKAAEFGNNVDLHGFEYFEIEVEFGIIPSITVKFAPLDGIDDELGYRRDDTE